MVRKANGNIEISPPNSPFTGYRHGLISTELTIFSRLHGGLSCSDNTGFQLSDTSVITASASYISPNRLARHTVEDLNHFSAIIPTFVVEVVSQQNTLTDLTRKIRNSWIANGVQLAWLVDVNSDRLWIYRADKSVELVTPLNREITGEDVLPGFTFDLRLLS